MSKMFETLVIGLGLAAVGFVAYSYIRGYKNPMSGLEEILNDYVIPGGKTKVPSEFYDDEGVIHPRNLDFKKPTF
jgi:hypothetical protein